MRWLSMGVLVCALSILSVQAAPKSEMTSSNQQSFHEEESSSSSSSSSSTYQESQGNGLGNDDSFSNFQTKEECSEEEQHYQSENSGFESLVEQSNGDQIYSKSTQQTAAEQTAAQNSERSSYVEQSSDGSYVEEESTYSTQESAKSSQQSSSTEQVIINSNGQKVVDEQQRKVNQASAQESSQKSSNIVVTKGSSVSGGTSGSKVSDNSKVSHDWVLQMRCQPIGLRRDTSSASNFTGCLTLHAATQQCKHCCFTAGLASKMVVAIRADLAQDLRQSNNTTTTSEESSSSSEVLEKWSHKGQYP
ncbi:hypothetical protein MSG28_015912 [Choristoneura fumiferana]|uniref:Uncharacterized protein n=1 Tax=Choristoneura fumiferana TaxID=7141 RepID=A0ACC0K596_CHOFU|nr:hypothetical protein MSG28_015912 [Choristoneura fumiferana]